MFAHLEPFGQSVPINKYIGSNASLLNILILPTVSVLGEVNVLACLKLVCSICISHAKPLSVNLQNVLIMKYLVMGLLAPVLSFNFGLIVHSKNSNGHGKSCC